MLNIILMGPPGAGKGTAATWIREDFHLPHISTGDMFREAMASGSPLGEKIRKIVESGGLVSDELTCELVKERLLRPDCQEGYLLDGFPRTIAQAEELKKMGEEIKRPLLAAINLACPAEILVERVTTRRVCPKCGASYNVKTLKPKAEGICDLCGAELIQRKDDNEEAFRTRLENYRKSTEPLLGYYREAGLLHEFDGTLSMGNLKVELSAFLRSLL